MTVETSFVGEGVAGVGFVSVEGVAGVLEDVDAFLVLSCGAFVL